MSASREFRSSRPAARAGDPGAPDWVLPVMRVGYGARAATYAIIGVLAGLAAWTGGETEGSTGALAQLRDAPMGLAALWVVAAGLLAYALWRFTDAALDLDAYGRDARGILARLGQLTTGALHAVLGFTAARIALGSHSGEDDGAQGLVARLMELPYGPALVMAAGAVTIGAGGYYVWKALDERYKKRMRRTALTDRLDPLLKAGLIAHGIVIALVGAFILYAGLQGNAGEAGGLDKAFATVRAAPFGRTMLFVLAAGTVLFGLYCAVQAVFRIIPRHDGPDVDTLAGRLSEKVRARLA